jgi:hypothetical protein
MNENQPGNVDEAVSGVQTFSRDNLLPDNNPNRISCWKVFGAGGLKSFAESGSVQDSGARGNFHLYSPTGGVAKGIPRNSKIPETQFPATGPKEVETTAVCPETYISEKEKRARKKKADSDCQQERKGIARVLVMVSPGSLIHRNQPWC